MVGAVKAISPLDTITIIGVAIVAILAIVAIAGDWTSVGVFVTGPPVSNWRPLLVAARFLRS
jgi:hypothetical protein